MGFLEVPFSGFIPGTKRLIAMNALVNQVLPAMPYSSECAIGESQWHINIRNQYLGAPFGPDFPLQCLTLAA